MSLADIFAEMDRIAEDVLEACEEMIGRLAEERERDAEEL